jgi:hypothetical protein
MKNNLYTLTVLVVLMTAFISEKTSAQSWILADLTTNPLTLGANSYNAAVQFQTPYIPEFSIGTGIGYQFNATEMKDFQLQSQSQTWQLEGRYYPFGQQTLRLNKKKRRPEICNGHIACLVQWGLKAPSLDDKMRMILRGLYMTVGVENRQTDFDILPDPRLEAPKKLYQFSIQNKAWTLGAGYQIRVGHITLGASYRVAVGKPTVSGDFELFKDALLTNTFPTRLRVEQGAQLTVGLNF